MISPSSRVFRCATLFLALSGARCSFSQSAIALASSHGSDLRPAEKLPDAPSYSSSQQSTTPTQPPTSTDPQQKTPPAPPANETEEQRKERERKEAEREVEAEKKQRIGGIIPDFNVAMNGQGVALTPKQKFDLSFHTIIDPYTFALAILFGGGLGELEDSHTGYGHGPAGLGKRIGASYADNVSGNLIGNALLPVVLKQDPRYFRKGRGSIKSRIVYSALTTVICHSDTGKSQFNTSNVLGNFISGAISNVYYPSSERGVGLTIDNALLVTLEGAIGAQLLEFSPDVTNAIHRRRDRIRQQNAAAAAANGTTAPPATPAPAVTVPPATPLPPAPPQ